MPTTPSMRVAVDTGDLSDAIRDLASVNDRRRLTVEVVAYFGAAFAVGTVLLSLFG